MMKIISNARRRFRHALDFLENRLVFSNIFSNFKN
jgi:hypothetical protein